LRQDLVFLEARNDGIFMTLPEGKECPSIPLLLQFLNYNGIIKFDSKSVDSFVHSQGKKRTKIAERDPGFENDAVIDISISKDYMETRANITPPFFAKPWPTQEQINDALTEKNVIYGIDYEAISDMVTNHMCNESVIVAKGLQPVAGKNGWVEMKIDLTSRNDKSDIEEKIDYRERNIIINVSKGDVLAVQHPPTNGTDGINIANIAVKAKPGKQAPLPIGAGTIISDDGLMLLAGIDGCLRNIDNKLSVSPEFNVEGDLDFHIGNIDFVGAVRIKGSVKDGFQISAGEDIEIYEVVEGACINSKKNIRIKGGVRGMNKASITATGKIEIGFVDQAIIAAGTDIIVHNAILHSEVSAGGSVIVSGGKSQIAGGKIQAAIEVSCSNLGSEMGTKTEVIVGVSPTVTLRKKELVTMLASIQDNIEKIDANLSFLKKLESTQSLDDTKRSLMISATRTKFQLQAQQQNAVKEMDEIDAMFEITKSQGIVRVKNVCYAGVTIVIRGFAYLVNEPFKFCSFVYEAGEVKLHSYDYLLNIAR
jgi:uncharacterized protein (DUF342 family)